MPDIKTRDTVKGTIKTLDKAAIAGERMKEAYVRTKEKAEHGVYSAESSPEEYAADRFSGGTETVTYEAAHQFDKQGRKGVQATRENISKAKEHTAKQMRCNFSALHKLEIRLTPPKMNFFRLTPVSILSMGLSFVFRSKFGNMFMYRHSMKAPDEMRQLHDQFYGYIQRNLA